MKFIEYNQIKNYIGGGIQEIINKAGYRGWFAEDGHIKGSQGGKMDDEPNGYDFSTEEHENPQSFVIDSSNRDIYIKTIQRNLSRFGIDPDDIDTERDTEKVLESCGWKKTNNRYEIKEGFSVISSKELTDDDYVVYNGAKSLEGKEVLEKGGYYSKFYDNGKGQVPDSPALYTSGNIESALDYTYNKETDTTNQKYVSKLAFQADRVVERTSLSEVRSGFGSGLRGLPDCIVAYLAGFSVMHTTSDQDEYAITNPATVRIVRDK